MAIKKTAVKKEKRKKNLYETNVLPRFDAIRQWRADGQNEINISKLLGVSYASFCVYKNKYPEFNKLLSEAKIVLIEELEKTMFEAALGKIKITETKKFISRDKEGLDSSRIEETTKELGPNPVLLIFSLKNLCPERWGEKSLAIDMNGAMTNMSTVFSELKNKLNEIPTTALEKNEE